MNTPEQQSPVGRSLSQSGKFGLTQVPTNSASREYSCTLKDLRSTSSLPAKLALVLSDARR